MDSIIKRADFDVQTKYYSLSPDFLQKLKSKLPVQPWPIGIHKVIANELGEPAAKICQGINKLINDGVFYKQKDGIVYDSKGKIVAKDETRTHL